MTSTDYISKHKRLSSYTVDDYEILKGTISEANDILVTPNTLTEASNLAKHIGDPARTKIYELFRALVNFENTRECFVESRSAVARKEFTRLGLTDAALLTVDTERHILLTADHDLYQTACANGLNPPTTGLPNYRNEDPVYLAMPELANQLAFAMIDNYDARMGGGREEVALPGPMTGVNCETQALPTHKGCLSAEARAEADAQMRAEAVQKYLMWGRVLGATGEQEPGGAIDLDTGGCVDWLRIDGAVAELYDIAVIPGFARPMALTPFSGEAAGLITFDANGRDANPS